MEDHSGHDMMNPFKPHWDLYPKTYVIQKAPLSMIDQIDGDLTKDAWKSSPWSDNFDDIRGPTDAPNDERPRSTCRTRFKALWDDTHIYFAALLESDFETQARFTERNSPIYQKDSDFEVFVDPVGGCHNYKEFEVNAINTVWNLMLDKPYSDGGREYSGRIAKPGDEQYYEVNHQKSATKLVEGKLNDPQEGATWSAEIAMSFEDLLKNVKDSNAKFPKPGTMWRINFSRVEHEGDTNWTWAPQVVWDPPNRRYSGFVQMHLPDAWGYFVFADEKNEGDDSAGIDEIPKDPTWPARLAAMNIYYAQQSYRQDTGGFATTMAQLQTYVDQVIVNPFDIIIAVPVVEQFVATIRGNPDGSIVSITDSRLVQVHGGADDVSN